MDFTTPSTQPRAHKAEHCHCQLFSIPVSLFFTLSIHLSLSSSSSFICMCVSRNSPRTLNLCVRYLMSAAFSLTSEEKSQQRIRIDPALAFMTTWKLESFFIFIWHPSKIPAPFIPWRLRARHSNTPCLLLGPVTSLPGGARGRVHREEQAGDADLPLHPGHADLLQVQRRVGSPGRPLDWADCWPSHRYMQNKLSVSHLSVQCFHRIFGCCLLQICDMCNSIDTLSVCVLKLRFAICQWLLCSFRLLAHPPAYLACQSPNRHIGFSLRNLLDHLGDLFCFSLCCVAIPRLRHQCHKHVWHWCGVIQQRSANSTTLSQADNWLGMRNMEMTGFLGEQEHTHLCKCSLRLVAVHNKHMHLKKKKRYYTQQLITAQKDSHANQHMHTTTQREGV